jgi:hypothetical protein
VEGRRLFGGKRVAGVVDDGELGVRHSGRDVLFERDLGVVLIRRHEERGHVDAAQPIRDAPLHDRVDRPEIGLLVVPGPAPDEFASEGLLARLHEQLSGEKLPHASHAKQLHGQSTRDVEPHVVPRAEPHVGHAVDDDEAARELRGPGGQFEGDHAPHGESDHVGGRGLPSAQEDGHVPRKLWERIGPVAPLGPTVPAQVEPEHPVAIGKVIDLRGPVPAARSETVEQQKRRPSPALGPVETRAIDGAIRHERKSNLYRKPGGK